MAITARTRRNLGLLGTILLLAGPTMVGIFVFQYLPMFTAAYNSFRNLTFLAPQNARFIGLDNYVRLIEDTRFIHSLGTTLLYAAAKVIFQVPVALALALLVQQAIRGITIVRSAIFAPVVTAVSIAAVIWNMMYHPEQGLINTLLQSIGIARQPWLTSADQALAAVTLMSIWQDAGFTMLIFLAGLQGIPEDFYDAASIDGAGWVDRLRYITMPLLQRTTLYAVVTTTIFSFRAFTQVYVMTNGGPLDSTRLAVYHIYETGFVFAEMGYASAMALILVAILMVVAFVQGRLLQTRFEY